MWPEGVFHGHYESVMTRYNHTMMKRCVSLSKHLLACPVLFKPVLQRLVLRAMEGIINSHELIQSLKKQPLLLNFNPELTIKK